MTAVPEQSPSALARDIEAWCRRGASFTAAARVHRPSRFSALLAAALPDCSGLTVCDAGSGAGLVSVAALEKGARHVIAQDHDPAALADTERNVVGQLGTETGGRLSLWRADWTQLDVLCCDLLAVNPPQRPTRLLPEIAPGQRHLHEGGGADGLHGLRLVLAHAAVTEVWTTASSLLGAWPAGLGGGRYGVPRLIAAAELEHDPVWAPLAGELRAETGVWSFVRSSEGLVEGSSLVRGPYRGAQQ